MKNSDRPKLIKTAFATSGIKFDIPDTPPSNPSEEDKNKAAYSSGFPDITMQPISAGGKPPYGQDFNGLFYDITNSVRWDNAGGFYKFDDDFVKGVGGYPKGALIINDKLDGFFLSSVDDNTENPNKMNPPKNWIEFNPGSDIEIVQTTGDDPAKVMSQKASTDLLAKKKSQEAFYAGGIIINYGNPTLKFQTNEDNSYTIFELDPDKKVFKLDYRNPDNTLKNSVTFPTKSGTLALTASTDTIIAKRFISQDTSGDGLIETKSASGNSWMFGASSNSENGYAFNNNTGKKYYVYFPDKSGTLALDSNIIGINQRWQNVTSSRNLNVTYKNNTNKPIAVSFNKNYTAEDGGTYAYVDDVLIAYSDTGRGYDSVTPSTRPVFFIVPSNSTYRINAASKNLWAELR